MNIQNFNKPFVQVPPPTNVSNQFVNLPTDCDDLEQLPKGIQISRKDLVTISLPKVSKIHFLKLILIHLFMIS